LRELHAETATHNPTPDGPLVGSGLRAALAEPSFRWFLGGMVGYTLALSILRFLLPWLAFSITQSVVMLGVVGLALAVPNVLLTSVGGVWADRIERHRILRVTQAGVASLTLIFSLTILIGQIQLWWLIAFAVAISSLNAFDQPARQALMPSLVPPSALVTAYGLNSAIWSTAGIVGPAICGAALALLAASGAGPGPLFLAASIGPLAMVLGTTRMRPRVEQRRAPRELWWREFASGARFVTQTPTVRSLFVLAFGASIFGQSYLLLMPAVTAELWSGNVSILALLVAAAGAGSLAGTAALVFAGPRRRRGALVLGFTLAFGLMVAVFAASRWLPASVALAALAGAVHSASGTLTQTLVQLVIPDGLRGRVMGMYALNHPIAPVGAMILGLVAVATGAAGAVVIGGLIVAALATMMIARSRVAALS
jgi:MFS family permease